MKLIKIEHPQTFHKNDFPPLAIALGFFDGVHNGHRKVIEEAKKKAREKGLSSAVMTFDPHPSVILGKGIKHAEYITPLEDKIRLIDDLEIDYLFIIQFTQTFANLLPETFVDLYLINLNCQHVIAGFDFTFGKKGIGSMKSMEEYSQNKFSCIVIPKFSNNGEKVSSTRIRTLLRDGKMDLIPTLLGRFYQMEGKIVTGDKRGRTIGFPTANVEIGKAYLFPPIGVYAVRILVQGNWYNGVCNHGLKPTFNNDKSRKPTIEVHIFDFQKDIYGETVTVEWHLLLRSEKKFAQVEELVAQINRDKKQASDYFKNTAFDEKMHS
ncbi:bifunctional riboflavin kinase/FAD synthetase [Bacillaceae bacterium Marseille-Q3522]|nr:bifunctional riboflavin kinase/FAD synthetase [Bacillaceae bacterium Marseille-Q3522]